MTHSDTLMNDEDNLDTNTSETSETVEDETTEEENSQTQEQEDDQPQEDQKEKRWKEQLSGSKKEVERKTALAVDMAHDAIVAADDANKLIELHEKDPKVAELVAKKMWFKDYAHAKYAIDHTDEEGNVQEQPNDKFDQWYNERRSKEKHQEALEVAESILEKLPDNLQEEAKEYFEDLIEWKTLTESKARQYADMATLYVSKGKSKEAREQEAAAKAASTWSGGSRKPNSSWEQQYDLNEKWELVLISS